MMRLRHTDEWVGLLVILALVLFLGAVLDVGVLRDWFRSTATLRIVLPAAGVSGLSTGADVEVLGIRAGVVRRLVIEPNQQMYAEAAIDQQAQAFIRRDSRAVIRRRFGVAGAAFVDISRGSGTPMDWSYAVVQATTERAPTENVGALIDSVRQKVFPILDDTRRTVAALAAISQRMENGEGTVGRLVKDDALAQETQQEITKLGGVIDELQAAAKDVHALTAQAAASNAGVPEALRRLNGLLATLQSATHEIAQATPRVPQIARNTETATTDLPALLTQTQVTEMELQKLLTQLQGNWLLGGGGAQPPEARRVPTSDIHP
jgi:phospholipid/cholesterol/gamma-HCH transport system substrate-binding protein